MPLFKVGDICIGQNFEQDLKCNGRECEVLVVFPQGGHFVHNTRGLQYIPTPCYDVAWADGGISSVAERHLRKKPPKQEDLGNWDEVEKSCGWNPTKSCVS